MVEVGVTEGDQSREIGRLQGARALEEGQRLRVLAPEQMEASQVIGPSRIQRCQRLGGQQAVEGRGLIFGRHQYQAQVAVRAAERPVRGPLGVEQGADRLVALTHLPLYRRRQTRQVGQRHRPQRVSGFGQRLSGGRKGLLWSAAAGQSREHRQCEHDPGRGTTGADGPPRTVGVVPAGLLAHPARRMVIHSSLAVHSGIRCGRYVTSRFTRCSMAGRRRSRERWRRPGGMSTPDEPSGNRRALIAHRPPRASCIDSPAHPSSPRPDHSAR